jgi:hypothetical protein
MACSAQEEIVSTSSSTPPGGQLEGLWVAGIGVGIAVAVGRGAAVGVGIAVAIGVET